MADNSAAIAAMLMGQYGRPAQQYDPFAARRRFAESLMSQGTATTPVQSPLEGIARALQGGLSGFMMGKTDADEREHRQNTTTGLLEYANATGMPATTAEEISARNTAMAAAQEKLKGADPAIVGALAAQLIGQNQHMATLAASANSAPRIGGGAPAAPALSGSPAPGAPPADIGAFLQNMSPNARSAAAATNLDPRVVLAQTALETGYGARAPGNNFFGVKGPGQILNTTEVGPNGQLVPTQASFKTYGSPDESTADYVNVMKQPNMAGVLQAPGMTGQIAALGKSGYATDPQYAQKVGAIANQLSPLDPTDAASAFTMGRPGLATTASGTQINPNAQPPPFVQPQPQVAQAPGAPPVTVQQAPPPAIPTTTLPAISDVALDLQRQADAARATGTQAGFERSIKLMEEAHKAQAAHSIKRQETEDTRTYSQRVEAQKAAEAKAEEERRFQRGVETEAQKNKRELAEKEAATAAANAEHDRRKAAEDANKPLTEAQAKDAGYHSRMRNAASTIDQFEAGGKAPSFGSTATKNIPLVGTMLQNPQNQAYNAAKLDWISSQLRMETGANMPANEVAEMEKRYFPQPGEGPEIIKQKAQARAVAEEAMKTGAGPNYKHVPKPAIPLAGTAGPPPEAISQLRANPASAAQFDEVFGPGSAAKVLGR